MGPHGREKDGESRHGKPGGYDPSCDALGRKKVALLTGALQSPSLVCLNPMPPPEPAQAPAQPPAAPSPPTTPALNTIPERIRQLADISQNLWWSWQLDARELFDRIDHSLWRSTRHNAVQFLRQVSPARLEQ